ncbi:toxin-antitoxin system HicB family antitoxin [Desulfonatronum thioautotrophicum]|uniref:toxin-antitoxin system HicB family antitoxin n=1 Tax=Desulfonatronum thioautotrophicum TaxID=617001 RepID=UPI000A011324|nr:toxin-antitoxin system HicB family antitoxin [Desulfonatronum thioautotrophicum]
MHSTYSITLLWDEHRHGYSAYCPELPELSAFSSSPATAAAGIETQILARLDEMHGRGDTPPAPRHCVSFSGQFRLRLPKSLHAALSREAEDEGLSLNGYIQYLLAARYTSTKTVQPSTLHRIDDIQETVRLIQDRVDSLTFTQEEYPSFLWNNESASTISLQ